MSPIERLTQLLNRMQGYYQDEFWVLLSELAIIWVLVFVIFRFLRGTRGARLLKGVILLLLMMTLVIRVISSERLHFLYNNFLAFVTIALVIVFQPELRRALMRLGEARFFIKTAGLRKARVIEEVVNAATHLSEKKTGCLIAIEREVGLAGIVEAGTRLEALITAELLETIFWPGSPLHDMAVIVRGDRLIAAGVQLPLAEAEKFTSELGSRHRAAYGLSLESDALVVVVSEETGTISLAERGRLVRNLSSDGLRTLLVRGLGQLQLDEDRPATPEPASQAA